jgi:S-adenosylmethionine:tRNA ribosyltransferase-isomerase
MRVDLFDYELPPERIALEPARPRDAARLLHVRGTERNDYTVADLSALLRPGDLLIMNDAKVIPAQLFGTRKARGGAGEDVAIDATVHKRISDTVWRAFVRPAKRLREDDVIAFKSGLSARVMARDGAEATLEFDAGARGFFAALAEAGVAPLPPYIARRRPASAKDLDDYQTIYAAKPGSVAAPTAGLHFTERLMEALGRKGVEHLFITLHVGAGTFLPVTAEDTSDHRMHAEQGEITERQAARINQAHSAGGRLIAVGTTSLRLLETAANETGEVLPFAGETDIFITPGYRFKTADMLLTNFHLPRSTLFMLVCAFAGMDAMKAAYEHAVKSAYRFYSYGDACLLERAS